MHLSRNNFFIDLNMKSFGNINTSNPNRSCSITSSSNVTRRGHKFFCGYHTILLTCKQGPNAGRQFWRCPLWMVFISPFYSSLKFNFSCLFLFLDFINNFVFVY